MICVTLCVRAFLFTNCINTIALYWRSAVSMSVWVDGLTNVHLCLCACSYLWIVNAICMLLVWRERGACVWNVSGIWRGWLYVRPTCLFILYFWNKSIYASHRTQLFKLQLSQLSIYVAKTYLITCCETTYFNVENC